jgi:hypothetical protein
MEIGLSLGASTEQEQEKENNMDILDTYSIGDVVKMAGLTDRQIRYLEEKGYIQPLWIRISSKKQRRYTESQAELLKRIGTLRKEGYRLPVAVARALGKETVGDNPSSICE